MATFVGYHGTKRSDARNIERTNFIISNKVGWLGRGAYLFEESSSMARKWATYKYGNRIEVLEAVIEVQDNKVFDITHPYSENTKDFYEARDELIKIMKEQGLDLEEVKNELDGKVLDYICRMKGILLVRAFTYTFQENDRAEGRKLFSRFANGIELCVKNSGIVKQKNIQIAETG